MAQRAVDAIDALKPYKGGHDVLWQLDALAKIDKRGLMPIRADLSISGRESERNRVPSWSLERSFWLVARP